MGSRLYIKLKKKKEANKADDFLSKIPENKILEEIEESCINFICSKDIREAKKNNPNTVDYLLNNFGKATIIMYSLPSEKAEEEGYTQEDIFELQTKILEQLNQKFEVEYFNSGAFSADEYYFTIEQAKRITNNGKLMKFENYKSDDYLKALTLDPKDIKKATYKSGDKVIIRSDIKVKYDLESKHSLSKFVGTVVTIDFACVDGTYYIEEDEKVKISDDLIDCKVDDVVDFNEKTLSSTKLLTKVKNANEDFEWYPTTREIIETVYEDMLDKLYDKPKNTWKSILDIGAGNGKLFTTIKDITKSKGEKEAKLHINDAYAIEKSQILLNSLDEDIYIVGTDFNAQTLIDKKVDVIFCNPPYSEYEQWSERIIKEANCDTIYLVIPKRWVASDVINNAIKARKTTGKIVGEFDFENSEDRKARAKVSLVKIQLVSSLRYRKERVSDPFDIWFDTEFSPKAKKSSDRYSYEERTERKEKLHNLVKGDNLIERLEELYNKEFANLISNYKKVSSLDAALLEELNVSVDGLKKALKLKIEGLKNLYWQELFHNMGSITCRLTSESREIMLKKLFSHVNVDFTKENAYAVVLWAVKNANKYFDSQLLDIYYDLTKEKNVKLYKSNYRMVKDGWRFIKEEMSHYSLDYRIVDYCYDAIDFDYSGRIRGMGRDAKTKINDIIVIAKNLGFDVSSNPDNFDWVPGKSREFLMNYLGERTTFAEIKAFKNGNLHFKFNQKFMKAFNIEAARLNKWIKSPKEASEEFDISVEEANELFKTNLNLLPASLNILLPYIKKETQGKEKSVNVEAANNMPYNSEQVEFFTKTGTLF